MKFLHPLWRMVFLPFYSVHDVVLFVVLLAISALVLVQLGVTELPLLLLMLASGYLGGAFFGLQSSPAILKADAVALGPVTDALRKAGYEERDGRWIPAFRMLRWPYDWIEICPREGELHIRGPYKSLAALRHRLGVPASVDTGSGGSAEHAIVGSRALHRIAALSFAFSFGSGAAGFLLFDGRIPIFGYLAGAAATIGVVSLLLLFIGVIGRLGARD